MQQPTDYVNKKNILADMYIKCKGVFVDQCYLALLPAYVDSDVMQKKL